MSVRALIVDDSSVMRKIVERSLRQAGLQISQVFEASNGAEALGLLQNESVDLILSDINMPVMDGLEFVKGAQSLDNAKNVPIVGSQRRAANLTWYRPFNSAQRDISESPSRLTK